MIVVAVVCIVEREEATGRPAVEAAAQRAPFLRLYTANDVRAEHVRQLAEASPETSASIPILRRPQSGRTLGVSG